jgi:phospholipid/cholesterol/gamma-HCH transport system substrate-binding protein
METQDAKQSIKLGAFVLGGLVLFLVALFFIGSERNVFARTFQISAIFKNIEGLKEGDNVWLSGVKIGTVKHVQIITEGKVVVTLSLKDKQNEFIRKDATAFIGSDGLVGNKIVVIRTGKSSQIIDDYDTINSLSPPDTQELINIAKEVGDNTKSLTTDLKTIAAKINNGQGIVGELLNDGPLAQDFRKAVNTLKQTGANTARASSDLSALLDEMKNGDGLLATVISDTAMAGEFQQAMANVKKVSNNASAMAANLEEVTEKMNSRKNAVGVLLADTIFAGKLQTTLDNAQSASYKLDEDLEALQHNFLFRGYFKKKKKAAAAEATKLTSRNYPVQKD